MSQDAATSPSPQVEGIPRSVPAFPSVDPLSVKLVHISIADKAERTSMPSSASSALLEASARLPPAFEKTSSAATTHAQVLNGGSGGCHLDEELMLAETHKSRVPIALEVDDSVAKLLHQIDERFVWLREELLCSPPGRLDCNCESPRSAVASGDHAAATRKGATLEGLQANGHALSQPGKAVSQDEVHRLEEALDELLQFHFTKLHTRFDSLEASLRTPAVKSGMASDGSVSGVALVRRFASTGVGFDAGGFEESSYVPSLRLQSRFNADDASAGPEPGRRFSTHSRAESREVRKHQAIKFTTTFAEETFYRKFDSDAQSKYVRHVKKSLGVDRVEIKHIKKGMIENSTCVETLAIGLLDDAHREQVIGKMMAGQVLDQMAWGVYIIRRESVEERLVSHHPSSWFQRTQEQLANQRQQRAREHDLRRQRAEAEAEAFAQQNHMAALPSSAMSVKASATEKAVTPVAEPPRQHPRIDEQARLIRALSSKPCDMFQCVTEQDGSVTCDNVMSNKMRSRASCWRRCMRFVFGCFPDLGAQGLDKQDLLHLASSVILVVYAIYIGVAEELELSHVVFGAAAPSWVPACDLMWACVFVAEISFRMIFRRVEFFFDYDERAWNCLDLLLTMLAVGECVTKAYPNPAIFRSLRVLRVVKLFRYLPELRALRLLGYLLWQGLSLTLWSMLVLILLSYAVSILLMQVVVLHFHDERFGEAWQAQVRLYFGGLFATLRSVLASLTGGIGWSAVVLPLQDVSVILWALYFFFVMFVVCGLFQIVIGISVYSTHQAINVDKQKTLTMQLMHDDSFIKQVVATLSELDKTGVGLIDWEELDGCVESRYFRYQLDRLQVQPQEARAIFKMLDVSGCGQVNIMEYVQALMRYTGSDVHADVTTLLHESKRECQRWEFYMEYLQEQFAALREAVQYNEAVTAQSFSRVAAQMQAVHSQLVEVHVAQLPLSALGEADNLLRSQGQAEDGHDEHFGDDGGFDDMQDFTMQDVCLVSWLSSAKPDSRDGAFQVPGPWANLR
eukprot:TRINITY_DN47323_c0_g1_i1.p1 TRINITY_DN47323_c0_g1~~TRINITY_DN47323_c0_g1_i1.p1  ORF type:complete len:1023 (-),score=220.66 TRINITY_DN47323_c0_g1_i1:330-3398(-)